MKLARRRQLAREAISRSLTETRKLAHMLDGQGLVPVSRQSFEKILSIVVHAVRSTNSQRAYRRGLLDFLEWYQSSGQQGLNKAVVQEFLAELQKRGLAASSINLKLTAVRRLAAEASDNGLLAPELAAGIGRVKGVHAAGRRTGQWLTRAQTVELLAIPAAATNRGKRDRVVLALLVGCGLRRSELVRLRFEDVRQRDGRWVILNLKGKGNRVRTVPMPSWAKVVLDDWLVASGLSTGPVLRAVNKSDHVLPAVVISPQSVLNIVKGYGVDLGFNLTPHDLRRTFAKLAHVGHAALEQIQLSLGHASILTTERYLGVRQDLADAPCDHLGLSMPNLPQQIRGEAG
jgi:site-specific recombinase XerD